MSLMVSNIRDADGHFILASCPFYPDNPLCVNSCACFIPVRDSTHEEINYNFGWCGVVNSQMGAPQALTALREEDEEKIRSARGWNKRHA